MTGKPPDENIGRDSTGIPMRFGDVVTAHGASYRVIGKRSDVTIIVERTLNPKDVSEIDPTDMTVDRTRLSAREILGRLES